MNKIIWANVFNPVVPCIGDYGASFIINGTGIGHMFGCSKMTFITITAMDGTKFYADYRTGRILGRNMDHVSKACLAKQSDKELDSWVDNYRKTLDLGLHEAKIKLVAKSEFWDILQCRG